METQNITIHVKSYGEKCVLTDEQIKQWYLNEIKKLFNPDFGPVEVDVEVVRSES